MAPKFPIASDGLCVRRTSADDDNLETVSKFLQRSADNANTFTGRVAGVALARLLGEQAAPNLLR